MSKTFVIECPVPDGAGRATGTTERKILAVPDWAVGLIRQSACPVGSEGLLAEDECTLGTCLHPRVMDEEPPKWRLIERFYERVEGGPVMTGIVGEYECRQDAVAEYHLARDRARGHFLTIEFDVIGLDGNSIW